MWLRLPRSLREAQATPPVEFQVTLDRRELAAILAGLRLLRWANGPDWRLIPTAVRVDLDRIEGHGLRVLSDAELRELVRRLGS